MIEGGANLKKNAVAMCLSLVLVLLVSTIADARTFRNIVAFGDSLSDHYGLQSYFGPYDPVTNPTGVPAVWSNGDVWVEYLAGNWGAALDNNAIAGAMTQGHENASIQALSDAGSLPDLGLAGQVDLYVASLPVIDSNNTLFTIWIGGNDLMEFGRGECYTPNPNVMIADAMTRIANSVVALYAQGATNFLLLNMPDIGKAPGYNSKTPAEIATVTLLVQVWNNALVQTIASLEADLPGIAITLFDVFSYINEIISSGAFANVTGTYMELDAQGNKTGNVNGNADDYLFWDNIHPMTRTHEMVADKVAQTPPFKDTGSSGSGCFITAVAPGQAKGSLHCQALILMMGLTFMGIVTGIIRRKH